jgi:nicotinate-nucleotide adenylyltransferase
MLVLATRSCGHFYVSTVELERGGTSYTIDTLRELRHRMGGEREFYFIMGADAFRALPAWKEYEEVLRLTHLVVVSRPGHALSVEGLPHHLHSRVRTGTSDQGRMPEHGPYIYLCSGIHNETSATVIRAALRRGEAIAHLVPPDVAAYIEKYRLYRDAVTH